MNYAPHTIKFRHPAEMAMDEFGRPIAFGEGDWLEGGDCRCDNNSTQEFTDDNGRTYRPAYKVVVEGKTSVREGDEIEVYVKGTDELRGKGKVYNVIPCNYLPYSTIWV